eukprot:13809491-Ditylum_brightwellii.AAC.1
MVRAYLMDNTEQSAPGQANKNTSALSTHMVLRKHWQDFPLDEKSSPDQIRSKLSLNILFQANP